MQPRVYRGTREPTTGENTLSPAPREGRGKVCFVWCLVIAESNLCCVKTMRAPLEKFRTHIAVDSVDNVLGRQWRNLGVNFRKQFR
jgi:hypothetical protein